MDEQIRELQPKRLSFMWPRVVGAAVLAAILSLALLIGAAAAEMLVLLALLPVIWIGILLPAAIGAHIAFTKERYEIHPGHLICYRGTIFSDGRTELDLKNVTHVRVRLPWLRYRLWGIGDVRVESAGSAAAEITFQSIIGPEELYEEILTRLQGNGFALQRGEVLHQESPGVIGALTDVAQVGIGGGFTVLFLFGMVGGVVADAGVTGGSVASGILLVVGAVVALLSVGGTLAGLVIRYLDMTRRTYTVYDDAVAYTEGFLTRDNAVIPFENIADASTNRTFWDQLLGLYDVKVSCQGSGSEIMFRRLSRGEELQSAIRSLVAAAGKKSRDARVREAEVEAAAPEGEGEDASGEAKKRGAALPSRKLVDPDEAWTAELKMHMMRAQVPLLTVFLALPAWVMAAIGMAIKVSRTTYTIGPDSMSSSYSFIGANQQEFAYDKVTGVQVERNPLDDFFGTLSIQIWSIGSSQPLNLTHVSADDVDLQALLRQCGIPEADPPQGELSQSFGPKVWAIQNIGTFVALVLLTLGLLIGALFLPPLLLLLPFVLLLPLPMAVVTRMRVQRQHLTFHAEHVEARTGIFFRKHIYARYDNVKKAESTQIPLTDQGKFKLYVAGEQVQQQQQQQGGVQIKIPYSLEGRYIEGISAKVDAMDALMLGKIEPSEITGEHPQDDDVISVSKPAMANAVLPLALFGLIFPPLWLMIPVIAWQIKVRSYSVESDRVVERGGILFKYAVSVLFDRIDSLQQHQGALGKAFGNGQVILLTAGSSTPDLLVANVPDYTEVYGAIRKNYGK